LEVKPDVRLSLLICLLLGAAIGGGGGGGGGNLIDAPQPAQ